MIGISGGHYSAVTAVRVCVAAFNLCEVIRQPCLKERGLVNFDALGREVTTALNFSGRVWMLVVGCWHASRDKNRKARCVLRAQYSSCLIGGTQPGPGKCSKTGIHQLSTAFNVPDPVVPWRIPGQFGFFCGSDESKLHDHGKDGQTTLKSTIETNRVGQRGPGDQVNHPPLSFWTTATGQQTMLRLVGPHRRTGACFRCSRRGLCPPSRDRPRRRTVGTETGGIIRREGVWLVGSVEHERAKAWA